MPQANTPACRRPPERPGSGIPIRYIKTCRTYDVVSEIGQLSDVRKALGQGGYVVEVKKKGSRIHSTACPYIGLLRKSFGAGKEYKRNKEAKYFHTKSLEAARLFWAFERVGPDIMPCEQCQPCGTEAPDIPDCDRRLYDWMKLEGQTIADMNVLMRKFVDAYAAGGQGKDAFTLQARATRKLAESGTVRAVEMSDGHGKDVDVLLRGGLNIQVWRGKYEPDYESERAGHEDSRRYERRKIEAGAVSRKLDELPDGEKGLVVNIVPGDTMYGPPESLLTVDKCVISSEDCKNAIIYRDPHFAHIEDARRICSYLDWNVVGEKDGMGSDFLQGVRDGFGFKEEVTLEITDIKTGRVRTVHNGGQEPTPAPADDSWCGCV